MNKLKGYGTYLDGWEKWGDYWVISPKVKNIFDFTIFILFKGSRREEEIKFLHFILSFPIPHTLHINIFFKYFSCRKFCNLSILLAFKVCFLSFYTCSSCFDEKMVDVSYLNLEKCFIVMNLCSFDMEYQGFEVIF